MALPSEVNALLLGTGTEYQIARSLRFRGGVSPQLSRTLTVNSTSSTILTWSVWTKRGTLGGARSGIAYNGNTAGNGNMIVLEFASDALRVFFDGGGSFSIVTSSLYRDPSAWYHVMLTYDSTQATASNRARLFVNGVQVTSFSTANYPPLNHAINVAATNVQYIGNAGGSPADGYFAEINFIDGQALTPSSFGYTDPKTGVWMPKAYTGTYGANGCYLKFTDNSAATAAAIGRDFSGNGNNFTPTNISVTAGVNDDSMIDSPTNYADGGNGRGNYCVLSPINRQSVVSISDGNLTQSYGGSANTGVSQGTIAVSSGKWYYEQTIGAIGSFDYYLGVMLASVSPVNNAINYIVAGTTGAGELAYRFNAQKGNNGTYTAYGATYAANDVIGVALDLDGGSITFFKNGVSQGVAFTGISGTYAPFCLTYGGAIGYLNFGQRPFVYTPPAGFRALNTQNLPTTRIQNGAAAFDVATYTGTGATLSIGNEAFSPDLVWIKSRSAATDHGLYDTARGPQLQLESNTTTAETNEPTGLTAFTSNGFTVGSLAQLNTNAASYVAWMWDEAPADGLDIVTYVGTGSALNVSHNLGVAPRFMIIKARNNTVADNWGVYHGSLANTQNLYLNLTNAVATAGMWNSTTPTSSVFTVGANNDVNRSGLSYIGYVFAEVPGFSSFRSYVGNGSADGPFVFCGFRPRWVMIKRSDSTGNWVILDTAMNPLNVANLELYPNLNFAENGNAANDLDFLSNGFKVRNTNADYNASGGTYVFAAFAENPFKIARAR